MNVIKKAVLTRGRGTDKMTIEARIEPHVTDEEAVARVLNGDAAAYEIIMRRYNQRLFRIVRAYVPDSDEIDDIIQESYIKAFEHLHRFERRSRFSTWLIRIAINEALACLKRTRRFTSAADDRSGDSGLVLVQIPRTDTPLGKLMNADLRIILEKAVDHLPEKYRSVFLMREVEGMSVAETSESLEITRTNVKVRLNRAKEMLREEISGLYHDVELFQFDLVRCDRIVRNVLHRLDGAR